MIRHLLLVCTVLIVSCARPTADFLINENDAIAPATFRAENKSTHADRYVWSVNGKPVSQDKDLEYSFTTSGRHKISLVSSNEKGQSNEVSQEVIVRAPDACHLLVKTSMGDMIFELSEDTPGHLYNMSVLAEAGFYKELLFHRVISGFMIQGGDNATRREKKRYSFEEQIPNEINDTLHHFRGAIAAARMPDDMNPEKASSGTQFYIVHGTPTSEKKLDNLEASKLFQYRPEDIERYLRDGGAPQLDGEYTVFGYMVSGYNVLDKIAQSTTDKLDKPTEDIKIIDIRFID